MTDLESSSRLSAANSLQPFRSMDEAASVDGLTGAVAVRRIADRLGLGVATLAQVRSWNVDLTGLAFAEAHAKRAVMTRTTGIERLVVSQPFGVAWGNLQRRFPQADPFLMHEDDMSQWLAEIESSQTALPSSDGNTHLVAMSGDTEIISLESLEDAASPAVRLVNSMLYDALKAAASDIHLETDPVGLAIKFRLDGVIVSAGRVVGTALAEQIISRIKVMAELDIAERRIPQDGRLQVSRRGRQIDVRVSIMPSIHGEDAVLRLLDRQALASQISGLSLTTLGFDDATRAQLMRLAKRPHGMLLVTGPTGSGKTTTLYAALSDTHDPRQKTITIEDPVEYQLSGVLQIPVNERKGLDFATGLRSILRHDPDRILVGEIRDAETARIAIQSSLTGHMVFTTVHANGVLDVYGRFAQFGIDPYSLASSLSGILAQRLVRRICAQCSAIGCGECRGTGYRGRFAIGELLIVDSTIRNMIAERAAPSSFEEAAKAAGLVSLRRRAEEAVNDGVTTLEEIDRVTAI